MPISVLDLNVLVDSFLEDKGLTSEHSENIADFLYEQFDKGSLDLALNCAVDDYLEVYVELIEKTSLSEERKDKILENASKRFSQHIEEHLIDHLDETRPLVLGLARLGSIIWALSEWITENTGVVVLDSISDTYLLGSL